MQLIVSIFNCIPLPFSQFKVLSLFSYLNCSLELNCGKFGRNLLECFLSCLCKVLKHVFASQILMSLKVRFFFFFF